MSQKGKIVGYTKEGRPIVDNGDGTFSTEKTRTIEIEGKHLNIPTMYGGKDVSIEDSIKLLRQFNWIDPDTGKKIPIFNSQDEAVKAAKERSKLLNSEIESMMNAR